MNGISSRLGSLLLLPPPLSGIWDGHPIHAPESTIVRSDKVAVPVEVPLFWYDPNWIRLSPDVADQLAVAVANLDVIVSAMQRDLMQDDDPVALLENHTGEDGSEYHLPRILPYRVERYGVTPEDFDHAKIIDVRVSSVREASGRLAYSPEQMERWERPPEDSPIAGGGYVAAGTFPPDVVSLKQLSVKLDQLRRLAPHAAVFVSIGPFRLEEEISAALVSGPDGLILRLNEADMEGRYLASTVARTRRLLVERDLAELPLWIVPGEVTADDAVKLIALGASAVAVDAWCNPLLDELAGAAPTSRFRPATSLDIPAMASARLWDEIDRVVGLLSSLPPGLTAKQYLGSFHATWVKACGVSALK